MKSIRFGIVILFLAVIQLSYCTNAVADKDQKALERAHFSPYNGKQQDWPISTKPILDIQNANTKHGVPIYRDLPGKPYVIIGIIRAGYARRIETRRRSRTCCGRRRHLMRR